MTGRGVPVTASLVSDRQPLSPRISSRACLTRPKTGRRPSRICSRTAATAAAPRSQCLRRLHGAHAEDNGRHHGGQHTGLAHPRSLGTPQPRSVSSTKRHSLPSRITPPPSSLNGLLAVTRDLPPSKRPSPPLRAQPWHPPQRVQRVQAMQEQRSAYPPARRERRGRGRDSRRAEPPGRPVRLTTTWPGAVLSPLTAPGLAG